MRRGRQGRINKMELIQISLSFQIISFFFFHICENADTENPIIARSKNWHSRIFSFFHLQLLFQSKIIWKLLDFGALRGFVKNNFDNLDNLQNILPPCLIVAKIFLLIKKNIYSIFFSFLIWCWNIGPIFLIFAFPPK